MEEKREDAVAAGEKKDAYLSANEAAERWGISPRRVRMLCAAGRVFAAKRDPETGAWRIPKRILKPTDGRNYRYREIPYHLQKMIDRTDRRVALLKDAPPVRTPEEDWRFFLHGSAFHMHRLKAGSLTLRDVFTILGGEPMTHLPRKEVDEVLCHCRALDIVRKAAEEHRPLTMTLAKDVYRALHGRQRAHGLKGVDVLAFDATLKKLVHAKTHPVIKAGNVLVEFYIQQPFPHLNERLGYMLANYVLLRAGYPPFILYRAIFRSVRKYQRTYEEMCTWTPTTCLGGMRLCAPVPPPQLREAYMNACVIRAVGYSCTLGLRPLST